MKKQRNNKTLANILLRNYVLSYFIITILVLVILIATLAVGVKIYFNINNLDINNAKIIMKDNYEEIDTTQIEKLKGFIEIIDKNHNVIYRKGINPNKVDRYTAYEYYELNSNLNPYTENLSINLSAENIKNTELNPNDKNGNKKYVYTSSYNMNKEFLLVVGVPENELISYVLKDTKVRPKQFFISILIIDLGILILVFLLLSRATSRRFIKPLKILTDGAKQISKGNYDTRINLKSSNEFGELRDAFNHMAEKIEIERKLKEKSEENRKSLILDISHDLKNPLSSIMGYSEYILKNSNLTEDELLKYLETIWHNSQRADGLIQALFQFSKVESSEFRLTLKSMDICEFLRELIASYIPQFEDKGIDYDFNIPEEKIFVAFDEKNLDRALSNLIINAIKYNPSKTKVVITAESTKQYFSIRIEDNGIGIPKEMENDVFSAFVRVDTSRNSEKGGTGLGLAITKKIIEKHGGTIELETLQESGCRFIIKLPMN